MLWGEGIWGGRSCFEVQGKAGDFLPGTFLNQGLEGGMCRGAGGPGLRADWCG